MEQVLNFIVSDLFGNAAIFIALIAVVGLLLLKRPFNEVMTGGLKTAIGTVILSQGTGIIVNSISFLTAAFNAISPASTSATVQEIGSADFGQMFGRDIGIVMLVAFLINILVARFTKFKTIFLTGHMLYWFPFIFIAAGYDAGMRGIPLIVIATLFTAAYMIISPNLFQPFVRAVTGSNDIAIGHPTTILSIVAGLTARVFGNKAKSTEDIKMPKSLSFLKEIGISSAIVICLTHLVFAGILAANGIDFVEVFKLNSPASLITFSLSQGFIFGAGITVMMLGVRMMVAEIVPAFKGISNKFVPDAIPALDCALLFPYAPNAMVIGFLVSMVTSIITIILTGSFGLFQTVIFPLTVTCCFEIGTAGVISNAQGGLRGTIIGTAVAGVLMVLLVGVGAPFFMKTVNSWLLVYGGNDFSFWGIIEGLVARLFVH